MHFKITPKIFQTFPCLTVGVVIAKNIDNTRAPEALMARMAEEEKKIRGAHTAETLSTHPHIAVWREAYRAFGAKPKENKSSVENLYGLVLRGGSVRHINALVDVYNVISLAHMVPVGGEDTDAMHGDIALTFAGTDEPAVLLLGDKEPRPPHAGEVIYKDDVSALCRRWNWREADRTKLTAATRNCILVVEGLPPVSAAHVTAATDELKNLVEKFCGGAVRSVVLDEKINSVEI